MQNVNPSIILQEINRPTYTFVHTEIGRGTILDVLGRETGNRVLDFIRDTQEYRHVWPLLENASLRLDWQSVQDGLQELVSIEIMAQSDMEKLLAIAKTSTNNNVTLQQVIDAMEGI